MSLKRKLHKTIQKLPIIGDYFKVDVPPGHYYSPIVSAPYIEKNSDRIFNAKTDRLEGINFRKDEQFELIKSMKYLYDTISIPEEKQDSFRYNFNNGFYAYSDGIFLNLVLRYFNPSSLIEVGSGFSSAMTLDTNDKYLDGKLKCSFIEPYPDRLYSLLSDNDKKNTQIIVDEVQNVPLTLYDNLERNDILFIDSSHIVKPGSDVNHIFFEILPRLNSGVLIHFHDIYYPFEYPKNVILGSNGFGSAESYLLRAFLMYNPNFEILLFNTFLEDKYEDWFKSNMPLCLKNRGGSIWLRKI